MGSVGRQITAEAWMATPTGFGRRPYRAYVPHPLEGWEPALTAEDVNAVTVADRALVAAGTLPQSELAGGLAKWMLARDESIRSSVMEGVTATAEGLAWAEYQDQAGRPVSDENEALTLGATQQVAAAVELGQRMRSGYRCTLDDLCGIHSLLFAQTRDRSLGGVLRDEPVWIGPPGCLVEDATFVPPPHGHVPALMDDLVSYVNTSDHPPVLRAVIAHGQFETIHPFGDGNGRTGRALIQTVLNAAGPADGTVPVSSALSRDQRGYYDALNATRVVCGAADTATRSRGLHHWLRTFSNACVEAERQAATVARTVEGLARRWQTVAVFRSDSAAAAVLAALPSMPVLDANTAAQHLGVTPRAARDALAALTDVGIVNSTGGRRNRRYTVPEMVALLRGMTPDGGLTARAQPWLTPPYEPAATAVSAAVPDATCAYYGPRAKRRCWLPPRHSGQHRYPPK